MKPKAAVARMREVLSSEGRESVLPHIARAFRRIAQREMQKKELVLSIARGKDEAKAKREVSALLKELKAKPSELTVHIDDTLIGGWRLEGREQLHDASFKKDLLSIYNRTTRV